MAVGGEGGMGRGEGQGPGGARGSPPPSCPPHPIICLYGISRVKINRGVGAGGG